MIGQSSHLAGEAVLPIIPKLAAPLRRQVLDELRQSIIAGRLPPGARLVERELIAMMGVSRTVIREALRQLESEGLIAIIPNKGPVVRALTLAEARDLYSIRAVLEGLAARLFVEHAGPAQAKQLERALDATAEAYKSGDPERILETKNRFYDVLFEGAGSVALSSMIGALHVRIWRWRALGLGHPRRSPRRSRESIKGLRAVLAAVRKRDAALAERRMREEVTRAAAEVVRLLAGAGGPGPGGRAASG
jgi:GntR family transcriptional regulator, trigonelline degradation regulator